MYIDTPTSMLVEVEVSYTTIEISGLIWSMWCIKTKHSMGTKSKLFQVPGVQLPSSVRNFKFFMALNLF